MAEARTRSERIRGRAAGLLAAGYFAALISFWVAGIVAYAGWGHGVTRLLGLAYFPILLLPFIGRGTLGVIHVHSAIWISWFALQMVLGAGAIWLNPYEREHKHRPRLGRHRSGVSRARSLARMPRI